jgi:hypothetical protein
VHRIVYLLENGYVPRYVDHINGNRDDNRIENLRGASSHENIWNTGLTKRNTSGVKGVAWNPPTQNWRAQIKAAGKKYTKSFQRLEEAQEWVEFVREELHGDFANHGKFEVQNGY